MAKSLHSARPEEPAEFTLQTIDSSSDSATVEVLLKELRPYFDEGYYLKQNPQLGNFEDNPLRHFIAVGWERSLDPSPTFSTRYYTQTYEDVRSSGLNPFLHYVLHGRSEGRAGSPAEAKRLAAIQAIRPSFDASWYRSQLPNDIPEVSDCIGHYVDVGWSMGFDPCPEFSTAWYLNRNGDVRASGINPFHHYVKFGRAEKRQPLPEDEAGRRQLAVARDIRNAFDRAYYLARYPEIAGERIEPVLHYVQHGAAEGRDPSAVFRTAYYLAANPDIARANLNPYWHYVVAGRTEGRMAAPPGGSSQKLLAEMPSLAETVGSWRHSRMPDELLSFEYLAEALRETRRGLAIALTHDCYVDEPGGIQLCVELDERALVAKGFRQLVLYPWQPLPALAGVDTEEALLLGVILDGRKLGVATADTVATVLAGATAGNAAILIVHSLMGHSPEWIAILARKIRFRQAFWWLHDYFSICPGYTLLRNNVTACGAPPVGSTACGICVYGEERRSHAQRMAALFAAVDFTIVSPSEIALSIWQRRSGLAARRFEVLPHCVISSEIAEPVAPAPGGLPVRVAFLGYPAPHKGWPVFAILLDRMLGRGTCEFHYFGTAKVEAPGLIRHEIRVRRDDPAAMSRALAEGGIDIVLHWASGPETFGITAHEAIAAGCAIIASKSSGNVAATVRAHAAGLVLETEEELYELFATGKAPDLGLEYRARRRAIRKVTYSTMTAQFIDNGAA